MLGFVVRRLLGSVLVLALSSVIVFTLVANSGNPLSDLQGRNPPPPPEVIELRRTQLNLHKSAPERYTIWLKGFVKGDMGRAIDGREVRPMLWDRLKITLRMVLAAIALALVLAITVGVFSAVKQYSAGDYAATFTGFLFLSMPVFWLALLLKLFLAIRLNRLLGDTYIYTVGHETPNLQGNFFDRLSDSAGHMVLPVLTLALIYFAGWSRFQRSSMLDVLNSDYLRLARAKGLRPRRVMVRHALRNALIPITTVVAIDFGQLIGGAVITEEVFAWKGMGDMLIEGIRTYDPNIVLAWLMVTAVAVVLFNLIADVLYGVLDPRIRYA
ncbi:MAG TPA: ABC transporter permease [Acidimicrobiales bacterium]|nr:ABC transporter permease [Acidimicrobiales bacterium]